MFEGPFAPPFYTDLYNFKDGAQNDIFADSYDSIPPPSPDQTVVPTPVQGTPSATSRSDPTPSPSNQVPFGTPPGRCSVW